jgi:hypothetical protein
MTIFYCLTAFGAFRLPIFALETDQSVGYIAPGLRQQIQSWLHSPRDPWPRFLFSARHVRVSKRDFLFDEGGFGLCM